MTSGVHRIVYAADVGLFLVLALPVINHKLLRMLLSFGGPAVSRETMALMVPLVGLVGVIGLGLSLSRLALPDTRSMLFISLLVKLFSSVWLYQMYLASEAIAFLVLATIDMMAGLAMALMLVPAGTAKPRIKLSSDNPV